MKKIIFIIYFFLVFLVKTDLIWADEYQINSSDAQVKVILDSKFGGAITKIYDYANFGGSNLINDSQAGAMFQTAFWLAPHHAQLPPGCPDYPDKWYDNPTQAGYFADGLAGNPIGIMGTEISTPDPNELNPRYEDNGKTIHFKSRFIRYDYCLSGNADTGHQNLWDTDFYIEQWANFHPNYPRALMLRSKLSYAGSTPRGITSRQFPVIFSLHLPRAVYWKNGQKVIDNNADISAGANPDSNWAAMIASNKEAGIGMVTSPAMTAMSGYERFAWGLGPHLRGPEEASAMSIGLPDLRTMGILTNVDYDAANNNEIFTFNQGGTFEWTTYYPIGDLNLIKNVADGLLTGKNFNLSINGYVDRADCTQTAGWAKDDRNLNNKLTIRAEAYPQGEESNKYVLTARADGQRPDLTGVCPTQGACAYGVSWGNFSSSFVNKKLVVGVYGVAADGQENKIYQNLSSPIGPCTNIVNPSLPGDLNRDGRVDIVDLRQLLTNFTGIFDYNLVVGNYGRTR